MAKPKVETGGPRRRGGQPGNLNALRHGFYSRALAAAGRETYQEAHEVAADDLAEEIALLRARIHRLLEAEPDNLELLSRALGELGRLCATQYRLRGSDADRLAEAMRTVMDDIKEAME